MQILYFKYAELKTNWQQALGSKAFKVQLSLTIIVLAVLLTLLSYFFTYIETRNGYKINDVLLQHLPSFNVSVFTFVIIYSAAILSIINVLPRPKTFLTAVWAYMLMLLLRLVTIYTWPLEAPDDIIPLQDPFVETFFYGHTRITKDLFFSGHVATVCILYLANPYRQLRYLYLSVVVLVAVLILIQHAHYSIDVLTAPLFACLCFWLAKRLA